MKKYLAATFILILFIGFTIYIQSRQIMPIVLNILDPVTVQADLNNNGVIDDGETICIPGTVSFSRANKDKTPEFANELNLSAKEIIALGYMADKFAADTLMSAPVKIKFTGNAKHDCKYAEIYINGQKYSDLLTNSGFSTKNNEFFKEKLTENLQKSSGLNLVIYNIKSGKYHELDCEYGLMSSDYTIIPKKQLPKDALPCKFCHLDKYKASHKMPDKIISTPQEIISAGDIKLILTDYTQNLKPDRLCNTTACSALLNEINNAKKSIDIAVYGMDDIAKLHQALALATARNVKIRMVYDKSFLQNNNYYKETERIVRLAGESRNDYLEDEPSYTNQLMHNKFFIFDNKTVFTGSMNLSATGLSDYNANAIVIINSKEIANLYTTEFEQMLAGNFHNKKIKPDLPRKFILNDTTVEVYFSPYDKTTLHIIPLIDNAKKYIYMPAFLITHNELSKALVKAKQRKVDVKIIIDANSVTTRNTKHQVLRQNNIPLKTENYAGKLHSKSIIIDDEYIITGSMNFSNSGENKNDENLLIIKNTKLAKKYKAYFLYLWSKIPDIYLTRNARAESKDSIGSCEDGIDNDFDGLIDAKDTGCR